MFHDEGSLPIVDSTLLDNECEEFAARAKLCYYIIVVVVLVAFVVLEHIRVVNRLEHSYLICKVGFASDIALFDDFKSTILIEISVKDSLDATEGALA